MKQEELRSRLESLADPDYRAFQIRLMPTVDPATILGIRVPQLRALAKELAGAGDNEAFLSALPHDTYDENNLHAFLIERIRDYDACIRALEAFLPYVDNWATCDLCSPKILASQPERLLEAIKGWLASDRPYTVRYGIELLMSHFLTERFDPSHLQLVAGLRWEEYYVNMMIAWYFATALAKQYEAAVVYLEEHRLPKWIHNKTIQKSVESRRITPEQKAYLRTLRVKE